MKQRTLAMMTGFERYTKKTKRALFLEEMEQVVPWGELCALIEPYYPKAGNGRPPVRMERMLRIYFVQVPPFAGVTRSGRKDESQLGASIVCIVGKTSSACLLHLSTLSSGKRS